jgi:ABC-type transport system involved in multi-copper enzyme maturation permease subunit
MLLFAWLPAVWFGVGFFMWEQSLLYPEWRDGLSLFLRRMPRIDSLMQAMEGYETGNPQEARHAVWAWLLLSFFRYPQGLLMVLVVGLIAPSLISQDIRSRAFLLYFSRPLTRREYILGKSATVWAYLLMISTVPALGLYFLGVLLSPNLDVVWETWDLPLRILVASAVLVIPTGSLALCISSMTQETRYAGFAWFAVWILGWFTYGTMTAADAFSSQQPPPAGGEITAWSYVSLYHTLGHVESWVFGFAEFSDISVFATMLLLLTMVSNYLLLQRITAPMRA